NHDSSERAGRISGGGRGPGAPGRMRRVPARCPPPPAVAIQAGDVKSLAGNWEGYVTGSRSGTFDGPRILGQVNVKEDGTVSSNGGGARGLGTFRIVDGKAVYEGANMRGTATLWGPRPSMEPARSRS